MPEESQAERAGNRGASDTSEFDAANHALRLESALALLVERLREDRYVLAVVLVGSIRQELAWCRDSLWLWIIEADGVTRRRASDGEEPRIFRTLVEDDLDLHAEVIPRARFKLMVEGGSRTAFTHNFFAIRRLVWSRDESLTRWFDDANALATRDQRYELLAVTTWLIHAHRHAWRLLERKGDVELAAQELLGAAWALAAAEVVRAGAIVEQDLLYWAEARDPELFRVVYRDVLGRGGRREPVERALARVEEVLEATGVDRLGPVVEVLRRRGAPVPLSELCDQFAHSQLYPFHLSAACEWLARTGRVTKHSAPYKLTKKSRVDVEEPAYEWSP